MTDFDIQVHAGDHNVTLDSRLCDLHRFGILGRHSEIQQSMFDHNRYSLHIDRGRFYPVTSNEGVMLMKSQMEHQSDLANAKVRRLSAAVEEIHGKKLGDDAMNFFNDKYKQYRKNKDLDFALMME